MAEASYSPHHALRPGGAWYPGMHIPKQTLPKKGALHARPENREYQGLYEDQRQNVRSVPKQHLNSRKVAQVPGGGERPKQKESGCCAVM